MKLSRLISLSLAFICVFLLTTQAFAAEARSSKQISSYNITVTPATNSLLVGFSINGSGIVSKLGCESITIYEKSGSRWIFVDSWDENDSGMSRSNGYTYKNTIYCNSESGVEYKVAVTVFAENDDGRDTRTQTFYVTGK